jgi:hypothetical protein
MRVQGTIKPSRMSFRPGIGQLSFGLQADSLHIVWPVENPVAGAGPVIVWSVQWTYSPLGQWGNKVSDHYSRLQILGGGRQPGSGLWYS